MCVLSFELSLKSLLPFPMVTLWVSPMAQVVKNLPASTGNKGSIPDLEDPLEEEMATHSSILAWKVSWTEEPGGLQSMGSQRVGTTEQRSAHTSAAAAASRH